MKDILTRGLATGVVVGLVSMFSGTAAAIPAGWTCTGNCGTLGADGDVTAAPGGGDYEWVSTDSGAAAGTFTHLGIGSETNGSNLLTGLFSAEAGDSLEFDFNYITSDGSSYIEYAFAQILDDTMTPVDLLFTARTTATPGADTVPGFGLPPIAATMTPGSTPIIAGAPDWSPLGGSSGSCFSTGCGYTDWIHSSYTIADAGNYYLLFGVTNWADTAYDTGMAIAGATVGGDPIDPPGDVPEPGTLLLLGLGLLGLRKSQFGRRA
ncbi:MAG: NF038132 family protein [Pseudomonadales bacterium]|nr:NF038132 family protein [Pseudomonadales bacterium]